MTEHELKTTVKKLMARQLYGVLATQAESGVPHMSIVAFVSADNLQSLVFVTPRNSRKYSFLLAQPEVAFFVDDRRERVEDLMQVSGVEAHGTARELSAGSRGHYRALFLAKYPEMLEFVDAPGSAMVRIEAQRYDVVNHFQHLLVLRTGPQSAAPSGEVPS